jgi:phage protein D
MPDGDHSLQALVTINGSPLAPELEPLLESVLVDDHLHLPDMFLLTFRDIDRTILAQAGIRIGSKVVVSGTALGEPAPKPLITGEVTAIEGEYDAVGARAIVRGYDPSHRFHRGRHTETWKDSTDSDIARKVATRAGVEIGTIDESPTAHTHVSQANVSDWEFLQARAKEIGYEIAFSDGKFQFRKPTPASDAPDEGDYESRDPLQLVMGQELLEFRPRITSSEQVKEVEVRAWDPSRKQVMVATAPAATTSAQLKSDPVGLASAFAPARLVSNRDPVADQSAVDAAAKSLAERMGSSFAEASGVVRGTPALRAGTPFSVSVVGGDFEGRYLATTTRHVFDRDGYRTEFSVSGRQDRSLLGLVGGRGQASASQGSSAALGLMVAIVTDIQDPEGLGRVKIKLPSLSDSYESDWARVASPGAAKRAGLVFLPDVNDEVLVGFEHGDIRRPYILGGLWNGVDQPSLGDDPFDRGHNRRQGIVSRTNQRLVFFDDAGAQGVAMLTGDSKLRIALKQSQSEIHVFGDGRIVIEAVHDIQIKGQANVAIEAQGQLTLKGGPSGVKIESVGTVDVDGALIQLN